MPVSLPANGSTSWYNWATQVHDNIVARINVKDYGAIGDWTTDDTAAINAAIAAAKARTATSPTGMEPRIGGVVYFPAGFYKVTSTIVLDANDIHLVGEGKVATQIIASGLTSGSAVIKIGKQSGGTNTFGCTVENLKIDVNGVTNGVGVYTPNGQEGTGMRGVRVTNYKDAGFRAGTDGTGDPAAEVRIVECEFWSSFGGSNYALDFNASNGVCYVDTISVIGFNSASVNTTAVRVLGCKVNIKNVHVEGYGNGLVVDANSEVRGEYIMGGNGPGELGGNSALVYVDYDAGGVFEMLRASGTGVTFISERYSYTVPEGIVYRVSVLQNPTATFQRDIALGGGAHTAMPQSTITASTTLTSAHLGTVVGYDVTSTAGTITLPAIAGQPIGAVFSVYQVWTGALTVAAGTSSGILAFGTAVTSVKANGVGAIMSFVNRDGAYWLCLPYGDSLGDGTWNNGPKQLGAYRLWVDSAGKLRIKSGAPTSDTDGTVVGTQT